MTAFNSVIFEAAGAHLGLDEWPGAKHNPKIIDFFNDVGHDWVKDDETAWCAAFVGSVLAEVGLQHSGKLNARSYSDWGREVTAAEARAGDIVVFWRGKPNGWQGHVAFLVRFEGDKVIVRGGNQGNSVSDAAYPISRLLNIRRAVGNGDIATGRPLLKQGSKGAFVLDLQDQLHSLGYHVGARDGIFGAITKAGVLAFQGDNNMVTDGVVGSKTWDQLEVAPPRAQREKTEESLRAAGSTTIATADKGETQAKGAGAAVGGLAVVQVGRDLVSQVGQSGDALSGAQSVIMANWPIILLIVAGGLIYLKGPQIMQAVRDLRVKEAVNGENLSK